MSALEDLADRTLEVRRLKQCGLIGPQPVGCGERLPVSRDLSVRLSAAGRSRGRDKQTANRIDGWWRVPHQVGYGTIQRCGSRPTRPVPGAGQALTVSYELGMTLGCGHFTE